MFKKLINSAYAKTKFIIIKTKPASGWFNVKNTKHHKTLNIPFKTSKMVVFLFMVLFLIAKNETTPIIKYIMVHIIGKTMFGTHIVGFVTSTYQSIPKYTKALPKTATKIMLKATKKYFERFITFNFFILNNMKKIFNIF